MNISFRTLRVYGFTTPNTIIKVTVDGTVCKDGVVDDINSEFGNLLFSFVTPNTLHGKATISLEVVTGQVTFNKITATYPAIINGVDAFATFIQPIANPMVVVDNGNITTVENNKVVDPSTTFTYDHLMLNGPSRLIVSTDKTINVYTNADVYIGNIMTRTLANGILQVIPEYDYNYEPNNFNEEDLLKLKNKLY
jgi:hypothetical protein